MNYSKLERSVIRVSGEDRAEFLQGLITNDIHMVTLQNPLYALLLTPQGKFLFDFIIYAENEAYLLDTAANTADDLIKRLNMYKLRSKVTVEKTTNNVFALWGGSDGLPENALKDPRHPDLGYRVITSNDLSLSGAMGDYEAHRLQLGIPEAGKDLLADKSFPMENNMERLNALDFNKGCYVGQELTARTKHIGQVRKHLYRVTFAGDTLPNGAEIKAGDYKIGEMRSSHLGCGIALIRGEDYQKHQAQPITCADLEVVISEIAIYSATD